jgi:spoIIIJ-associated protein
MYVLEKTGSDYDQLLKEALKEMRLSVAEVDVRTEPADQPDKGAIKLLISPRIDRSAEARALLEEVLDHMGIYADVEEEEDPREIRLYAHGPNLGLIIGRKGSTIEAIEILLNLIHNKPHAVRKRILINAEGYRERRTSELTEQVNEMIAEIKKEGGTRRIELAQPAERKLVHKLVAGYPGFSSRSVGRKFRDAVIIEKAGKSIDKKKNTGYDLEN